MASDIQSVLEKLVSGGDISREEIILLLENRNGEIQSYLAQKASAVARENYGNKVFVRGLIEFTNYCKNDCYYCGIRCSNKNASRYRLTREEILECASHGYDLGFRTIVMQGGEDQFYKDDLIADIVKSIKSEHPDCAVTLSIGEKSFESYKKFFDAGADRYLLRHETADAEHYAKLHPSNLSSENRKECLFNLKKIGFQTGAGFMVGSPYQTNENIADDLLFLKKLDPEMIGIGPFIPHKETPFADELSSKPSLLPCTCRQNSLCISWNRPGREYVSSPSRRLCRIQSLITHCNNHSGVCKAESFSLRQF